MRRFPTMLASASAATLATLAITVAVPAIADNAGGSESADELAACLHNHGLPGAPDDASLKPWLGARMEHGDATAERAMAACGSKPVIVKAPGPSEKELRACLTKRGVEVPGSDGELKRWLMQHGEDAANRDALKACDMPPPGKPADGGPCGTERGVVTAVGPVIGRAGKPATGESGSAAPTEPR